MSQNLPPVDEARLAAEWEADKAVLANLAANGDVARIARPVDVSFKGSEKDFERVLTIASQFGFVELDREEDEEGDLFLFLECVQPVDEASIRALTKKCLQIEILCGVEYDGWGCEAQAGGVH